MRIFIYLGPISIRDTISFCPDSLEKLAESMETSNYLELSKWIKRSIIEARSSNVPFALSYNDSGYEDTINGVYTPPVLPEIHSDDEGDEVKIIRILRTIIMHEKY